MPASILDRIVAARRDKLEDAMKHVPLDELRARCDQLPPARDFKAALMREPYAIIAEIKKASPSRGILDPKLDPPSVARRFAEGGADAISVVTEPDFFHGALEWLERVRAVASAPVLRKDFICSEYQVWESRAAGADAILLILAILDDRAARQLLNTVHDTGLQALVEVHDETEASRASNLGVDIVGVNNRDLQTFEVSLETSERVFGSLPAGAFKVSESGIFTHKDCERLHGAGYDAFLVGEALVTAPDSAAALRALRGEHVAR